MRIIALSIACTFVTAFAVAQVPPAPPTPAEAAANAATMQPPKTIEHDGQTFELASSTAGKNSETDEYTQPGEKLSDWTQLLTVQRIHLANQGGSDEFVAYFQKRLQTEGGASLQILKQSKAASVFAVRFPKSESNDEQVMICLAFTDPTAPAVLNIIQFAIKPTRVSVNLVEMRIKSWRDRFLHQADAIVAKAS